MTNAFFGTLTIVQPGEPEHDHLLTSELMQIGSASGADIHVVGEQVARVHAQLRCSARGIWIKNLNNNFETCIDDTPIDSTKEVPLTNKSRVRFGKVEGYIRLAPGIETASPSRLSLSATPDDLTVEAGKSVALAVTIRNLADRTRTVILDVSCPAVAGSWTQLSQQSITLFNHPNSEGKDTGTVMVTFAPLLEAHSTANEYDYVIEARAVTLSDGGSAFGAAPLASIEDQDEIRTTVVKLHVLPFLDFDAAVETRMVQARRRGRVLLRLINSSNFNLPLMVGIDEPEAVLAFVNPGARRRSISTTQVVQSGEDWLIELPLTARRWRLFGSPRRYPFKLTVVPNTDDLRVVRAKELAPRRETWTSKDCTFVQPALVPYWALLILLLLVAVIVGALWLDGHRISFRASPPLALAQTPMIETLNLPGAVNTLNPIPLAFGTDGVVSDTVTALDTSVHQGQPIAVLRVDAQQQAYAQQSKQVAQATRAKQQAEDKRDKDITQAQQDLEKAQQKLVQVQLDAAKEAQQNIVEAQRGLTATLKMDSVAKTATETKMLQAKSTVLDAWQKLRQAEKDWDWVKHEKTHPTERYTDTYGHSLPRPLTEVERQAFQDAVPKAARVVSDTERLMTLAVQEDIVAHETATSNALAAVKKIDQTKQSLADVSNGKGTPELEAAQQAVDDAQRKLDELQQNQLDTEQQAIDDAQADLDAIVIQPPKILAPADGWVLKAPQPGDQVRASAPAVLFAAATTRLEVLVPLNEQQWQRVAAGRQITATLSNDAAPTALANHAPLTATVWFSDTQSLQKGNLQQAKAILSDQSRPPVTATLQLRQADPAQASASAPSHFLHIAFTAKGKDTQLFSPDAGSISVKLDIRLDNSAAENTFTLPPKKYICGSDDNQYIIVRQDYLWKHVFHDRYVGVDTGAKTDQQVEVIVNQPARLPAADPTKPRTLRQCAS